MISSDSLAAMRSAAAPGTFDEDEGGGPAIEFDVLVRSDKSGIHIVEISEIEALDEFERGSWVRVIEDGWWTCRAKIVDVIEDPPAWPCFEYRTDWRPAAVSDFQPIGPFYADEIDDLPSDLDPEAT
ncbi:hypothetical protein SAMN06297251_10480 [Fulvimarina manganoxydans]|uniref:Uncharacterized protein n=1 Tax=Fulvimarina manganoxydans TaxID=937218 RepID=A0A1W2ADK0_9HYPH|nr:hypothetical protein [Fulvimarina manganoxydans]SMC58541.1 hypothetical protein SAMN06297251_10480 [Fulvimarina manganoxydans]